VAAAISRARPWGVDVATGVEASPGVKDPMKVKAFVQEAKKAAAAIDSPVAIDSRAPGWAHPAKAGRRGNPAPVVPIVPYDWADDE